MFSLALAVPEIVEFSSALTAFFGAKKLSENKSSSFSLFPFTSMVAYGVNKVTGNKNFSSKWDSYSKNWSSSSDKKFDNLALKWKRKNNFDSYSKNYTPYVFNFDGGVVITADDLKKNHNIEVNDNIDNNIGFNDFLSDYLEEKESNIDSSFNDYIMDLLSSVDKRSKAFDIPKFDNLLQNVDIDLQSNTDSLLDVLSKNGVNTVTVLSALTNAITSLSVSNGLIGSQLVKELQLIRDILKSIPLSLMSVDKNSDLVAVLSKMGLILQTSNISDKLHLIKEELSKKELSVENNIDIDSLVNVLNNYLSKVAEAKELEKEHYEYMKTPQTYTLSDETLPNLAPRDVVALSEAVKAHLNSQEASLTGEELSDFEDDFDLGDVLTKLFNFKGITEDINKLPKE